MHELCVGLEPRPPAEGTDSPEEVDVLRVHERSLGHAAELLPHLPAQRHQLAATQAGVEGGGPEGAVALDRGNDGAGSQRIALFGGRRRDGRVRDVSHDRRHCGAWHRGSRPHAHGESALARGGCFAKCARSSRGPPSSTGR